jgi:phosphate transport system permease protein
MAPMLCATLCVGFGATLLAAPLGVATAIFVTTWSPRWLARSLRVAQVVLAGLPSVVFGHWGLTHLVPWVAAWQPPGASLLAAILVLTMMILPTIALTAQAALAGVPAELGQGAAALGLRRDAVLLRVALPAARRGILAGIVLALGRAAGETMAVVMVAGNVVQWPDSVFAPVRTLTANIALEMGYATDRHRSVLFLGGLLLLAMVLLFAWSAARIARRRLA